MRRFVRERLGISGAILGMGGPVQRTLLYSFAAIAVLVAVVNILNVITIQHGEADHALWGPLLTEGSSWISLIFFLWIPWAAWRVVPPDVRPRWKLLLHIPAAVTFAIAHVALFDLLRVIVFGLMGKHYEIGPFLPQLLYEARKDVLGYALFIGLFSLVDHLLHQPGDEMAVEASTFDIRDGAKLTRVQLNEILAVSSAGNYVEFFLADGRRLLMRAPLRNMELELAPRGFVRTHRSWLVNGKKVTTLKPDGSGDYTIELGPQSVPLSRRFPDALAKLRGL
ncbi:MAG TPA: LytTR family DNA-binding domain-containing protein [Rhizomicrobium sp.]|nr:LytTR family DNA-binding domain-containing protein [Rhizomicrobium sp.]